MIREKSRLGFTIVELLIVVVVIAILAAVTIISYNGISRMAEVSKLKTNFRSIAASLDAYKAESGNWPLCPTGDMAYSECFIEDLEAQFIAKGLPGRAANGGERINYVVMNNEARWAARFKKNDGTYCKMGVKMYPTWWSSIPDCW